MALLEQALGQAMIESNAIACKLPSGPLIGGNREQCHDMSDLKSKDAGPHLRSRQDRQDRPALAH